MALPKAACSSIKTALCEVDDTFTPDSEGDPEQQLHQHYRTRRFRMDHWERFGKDWYRFCVVRDPLRRLISCYQDRVVARRELYNCRQINQGKFDLAQMPDADYFFQNLKEYKKASSAVRHHVLPAWLFLGEDLSCYDDVFTLSRLPELQKKLTVRCGQEVIIPRENSTGGKIGLEDLSSTTKDFLAEFLAEEYIFLSDYFENPFATSSASRKCRAA